MDRRKLGVLDYYFASPVVSSRRSEKAMSFPIFGNNPNVSTAADEDVWNVGGRLTYMTAAAPLTLVSDSIEDNPSGTGLAVIAVRGLTDDYKIDTEILTLNGLTPVITLKNWLRVHVISGSKEGAADLNTVADGTITISDGANIQAQITAGETASSMSMFTVPKGYTGFFDQLILSGGPNDDFIARFKVRRENDIFVTRGGGFEITNSSVIGGTFDPKFGFAPEKSDTKFTAIGVTNNAQVRTNHTITIVKNDYLDSLAASI